MTDKEKLQELEKMIFEYCETPESEPYFYMCNLCAAEILQMAGFCHFSINKILQEISNIEVGRDVNYNVVYARDLPWYKKFCKKYEAEL